MRRRRFLSVLAAGAGVMVVGRHVGGGHAAQAAAAARLVDGLFVGMKLGACTLEEIHPPRMGALPLVLATAEGHRFQVDVLRRDPEGPQGVGNTPSLSVFLHNGGDGRSPTVEAEGLGAMALAAELAAGEARGAATPTLLSLGERRERFPRGSYCVLPARRTA